MGGDISVQSVYGKGSTFIVQIPQPVMNSAPIGASLQAKAQGRHAALVRTPLPGKRALVVDDVRTNLEVAKGFLLPYKMTVDLALSGAEAIEKLRSGVPYDCVFMDHMMPEMDGVEATKRIRAFNATVPIVALTANAVSGMREMFLENGFSAFLSKPINPRELDKILRQFV
jgi:CheY-like chemotaxis protein